MPVPFFYSHLKILNPWLIFILGIGILAASIIPGRANLGETFDQCIARYGQSSPPEGYADSNAGGVSYSFRKNRYLINVLFYKNVDTSEFITKEGGSAFSDEEKEEILLAEGGEWTKSETNLVGKLESWTREDGATATYDMEAPGMVLIANKSYATNEGGAQTGTHLFEIVILCGISLILILGCCYIVFFLGRKNETANAGKRPSQ